MFEGKSYEVILTNMLDRVPNTIDKRQGSIIYDALAPAAAELAQSYIDLDLILNNAFADTAENIYLDKKCSEIGITRISASKTIQKGVFTGTEGSALDIDIGSRFTAVNSSVNFIAIEKIANGQYKMQCEIAGSIGNTVTGQLIPISYIEGLQTANLTEILILGEDIEDDNSLRQRYYSKVKNIEKDGNVAQYVEWANEYSGIGNVKVFPIWNGNNTVKVSILNSNNDIASTELINSFQEFLDPNKEGLGEGVAPIGAIVTVTTATYKNINIVATVNVAEGYTLTQAQQATQLAIGNYFRNEISYKKNVVSYFTIGTVLTNLNEIESIVSLTLNGGNSDITLLTEEIPNLNSLTLTEST
ncbi:baseplate J/gp47 family protein [Pseudobacteroides cellulosolvens]|uniref:Baseplate J family protein n=1 Tax=Pseudobacteroides cellulosolvens ATCC 35603 = DSM 2933 TaxID=398512 RepID=A0A0L6JKD0_9FIRM|nr:baseplate J/gp47 family protein [Pseudobacteroides cellulosolvens]KNY26316.1 Baseplate J family protein [Pseudobacteroides cellulosolvens ATCC 35603 = DSM 2933]